jgi:ATP-binding protein involved in chromosome partitioning
MSERSQPTLEAVESVLNQFKDPETGRSARKQQIQDVSLNGDTLQFKLALTSYSLPIADHLAATLAENLKASVPGLEQVEIEQVEYERAPAKLGQVGLTAKSVIAVAAGKGGVGKSTVSAGLALTLAKAGCKVGILDADIVGPSIPHLLGVAGGLAKAPSGKVAPIVAHGMPIASMAFAAPRGKAMIWRGPMLHSALTQFLRDIEWGPLDYLIVDMPPGTSDVALSLSQLVPASGAVIACTPQEVALLDAEKAINMFHEVKVDILGLVENMSGFICPDCGKSYDIFGKGGARLKAEEMEIPFLGEIPLHIKVRERGDAGGMAALMDDDPIISAAFDKIAFALVQNLAAKAAANPPQPDLPVL